MMAATLQLDRSAMAVRSLRTLLEIAEHVGSSTAWSHSETAVYEAAREAKSLFDLLAWSDGNLDTEEVKLLNLLSASLPEFGESLQTLPEFAPANPLHNQVPALISAIVTLDRRTGDRLAMIFVDHLESFGYAVAMAVGRANPLTQSELTLYIDSLRNWVNMLANA